MLPVATIYSVCVNLINSPNQLRPISNIISHLFRYQVESHFFVSLQQDTNYPLETWSKNLPGKDFQTLVYKQQCVKPERARTARNNFVVVLFSPPWKKDNFLLGLSKYKTGRFFWWIGKFFATTRTRGQIVDQSFPFLCAACVCKSLFSGSKWKSLSFFFVSPHRRNGDGFRGLGL